jgi:hypothetical protein
MTITKHWWFLPAFSVALGVACAVAFVIGGDTWSALWAFAIMVQLGALTGAAYVLAVSFLRWRG